MVETNEIWLPVVGYEGRYEVSNLGRIKYLKKIGNPIEYIDIGYVTELGYRRVFLSINGKDKGWFVHVLVARAFIPNPENKPQVNHINGVKDDNRAENLEWANNSENQIHAYKIGLHIPKIRSGHPMARKVARYSDGQLIEKYDCMKEATKDGFSVVSICQSIRRNQKHRGYVWKYID